MKRRADEVQFGARPAPQRILTTQHSSAREYFCQPILFEIRPKTRKFNSGFFNCFLFFSLTQWGRIFNIILVRALWKQMWQKIQILVHRHQQFNIPQHVSFVRILPNRLVTPTNFTILHGNLLDLVRLPSISAYPQSQPIPTVKTNIGGPTPTVQYTTSKAIAKQYYLLFVFYQNEFNDDNFFSFHLFPS